VRAVEDFSEIGAIWRGEIVRAIKSGRAIALVLLFLLAEGLLLTVVGFVTTSGAAQMGGSGVSPEALAQKKQMLTLFTSNSEATIDAIVRLPAVVLISFFATTLLAPLLIALMGFDQLAGEIAPKSMRYLIVRVRRTSIILGKYLTQITILAAILVLCVLAIVGTAKYLNADFLWSDAFRWAAKLTAAVVVLGVSYAALTTFCSAVAGNSPLALFLNLMILFVFWFLSLLANRVRLPGSEAPVGFEAMKEESALAYLRYFVPSQYEHHLLSPQPLEYATGLLAYAAFGLIFLGLSQLVLQKRDL
jgi:ABC-type transport system involved in multi-copper enzyme maturation permease subunit